MDDLLAIERLPVEGQNGGIGEDVVVDAGPERAGKADIVDLKQAPVARPKIPGRAFAV